MPFRYRGYYFDAETEWYYLQSRYYNPEWGRFINADGYVSTGTGILGYNMFAYCRNKPVSRKDSLGTDDVCATNYDDDNNPLNDLCGGPSGGGCGGGVSSSYYAMQNVRAYDSWWSNSCYNPNMTWSNGTTTQPTTNVDVFQSFVENPESIKGKTASDISKMLGDTWTQGTYGTNGNRWKFNNGDKMIAYHPGGGRHVGSYYKLSSAGIGKIKIVGANYVPIAGDKALIIWDD
ncbi:MAG: RHS repeat-associated core domain-containing protein [Agathobacter sp.]